MKIAIRQTSSLALGPGLVRSVQHLLLTPRSVAGQTVREWRIEMAGIEGAPSFTDGFGNIARLVTQTRPEAELEIRVTGLVETEDRHGVIGRVAGEPPAAVFRRGTPLTKPMGAITAKLRHLPRDGRARVSLLHALMARVGEVFADSDDSAAGQGQSQSQGSGQQSQSQSQGSADKPETESAAPPRATAAEYAHAFIGAARALDVPARYVWGYVAGHDEVTTAHAWTEAWDDGLGWISFDPMLGYCPTDRHVRVAVGLDAVGAAAVRSCPVVGTLQTLDMQVEAVQ